MDSSLKGFKNMMDNTETFMEDEIEQLPIRMQEWVNIMSGLFYHLKFQSMVFFEEKAGRWEENRS